MTDLAERTRAYWSAAYYRRRAPDRDPTLPDKILADVARNSTSRLHDLALATMRETNGTSPRPDPEPRPAA